MLRHADTVWRVCSLYLRQKADKDDAFQNTFLKYALADKEFSSDEHRKAWLIRVAANACKDALRSAARREQPCESFEEAQTPLGTQQDSEPASRLLEALENLSENYRIVLYLTYFEGYSATEIGEMLGMPTNTVYTDAARGRKSLKEVLTHGEGSEQEE